MFEGSRVATVGGLDGSTLFPGAFRKGISEAAVAKSVLDIDGIGSGVGGLLMDAMDGMRGIGETICIWEWGCR